VGDGWSAKCLRLHFLTILPSMMVGLQRFTALVLLVIMIHRMPPSVRPSGTWAVSHSFWYGLTANVTLHMASHV
jgi:hypothetical protein